jgi:hypothetical protein
MILINIAFNSSISGIIHSKIVSLKSIASSSTIKAGCLVIFNSVFKSSSLVVSTFINDASHNSSNDKLTFSNNSNVFSSVQYILIFI